MKKHVVLWKPIRSRNIYGETYQNRYLPQLVDCAYHGGLLYEIVSMKPKAPISFEEALNLIQKESHRAADAGHLGYKPGHSHWFYENFIDWISDQGYHIELTGDEFETALMCSRVA